MAAGLERPDALVVAAMNPEEFVGEGNFASQVGTHLGLARVPSLRAETATSSGAAALFAAYAAVAAGFHRSVLVVGGEKMTHLPTPRVSELIGRSIDPYERSYGATMPSLAGIVTRAWMARTGATLRDISLVAVKNHTNGARNLDAVKNSIYDCLDWICRPRTRPCRRKFQTLCARPRPARQSAGLYVSRMSTPETIPQSSGGTASLYAHLPGGGAVGAAGRVGIA